MFAIVSIFRSVTPIVNGISGNATVTVGSLNLPSEGTIIDLKYLDDKSLLVLYRLKGLFFPLLYLYELF